MEIITAIEAIIEEKKDSAIQVREITYILVRIINPENVSIFPHLTSHGFLCSVSGHQHPPIV